MWTWLLIGYGAIFFIVTAIGLVYGFEFILKMMGFDMSYKTFNQEKTFKDEVESRW